MINVYALKGCDKCTTLVNELKVEGIPYHVIYDEDNEELFDELEERLDCFDYPIVEVHPNKLLDMNTFNKYIVPNECKSKKSYVIPYDEVYDIINILKTI